MEQLIRFPWHPSEDALENYAFHRLVDEDEARLEEHLLVCGLCQDALEDLDQFTLLMKAAVHPDPEGDVHETFWKSLQSGAIPLRSALRNMAWGGGLGMAVLAILVISWQPERNSNAVAVTLAAFRGTEDVTVAHASARHPLELAIKAPDVSYSAKYRIEIVTAIGNPAWNGALTFSGGELTALVPARLDKGIYWVRLYASDSALLREFGLRLD